MGVDDLQMQRRDGASPSVQPLLDGIDDPLILLSGSRIVAANRAAADLLERPLMGAAIDEVLPDQAVRALSRSESMTTILANIGGDKRHWELRVSRVGKRRRLLHLLDRTAIEAAERMRVDFVANASHELRTPIAAITGFAETLADDEAGGDPETRRHFLDIIQREARRMQRLVEDLMSLSRIEADRHVTPGGTVEMVAAVREAAHAAAEQRGRSSDLTMATGPHGLMVRGDAAQLAQLVHNLVSNGFKYSQPGTPVTVSLAEKDGLLRMIVADQGEGIAAQHLPRITQRFYRANAPRSRAVGGTGLGLAIVKHIVERHGGRLDFASALGEGTTVTVLLPLDTAPQSASAS